MGLAETRFTPKPMLTLSPPSQSRRESKDRLSCRLSFAYGDLAVSHGQKGSAILDSAQRRIVYRDMNSEREAEVTLRELGFRPDNQWQGDHNFQLSPRKLPAAVRELTARKWHVEVNGKAYRQPGKIQMQISSGIDWFELDGTADFEGVGVKLPALLQAISKGESTVVLDDGTIGILPEQWLKRYGLLAAVAEVTDETIQFAKNQVGLLDALLAEVPADSVDETFAKARDQLRKFEAVQPVDPPETFIGSLRPYQRDGLGWLDFLRMFGLNGCLADDMGLGKTVQVLALLEQRRLLRKRPGRRSNSARPLSGRCPPVPRIQLATGSREIRPANSRPRSRHRRPPQNHRSFPRFRPDPHHLRHAPQRCCPVARHPLRLRHSRRSPGHQKRRQRIRQSRPPSPRRSPPRPFRHPRPEPPRRTLEPPGISQPRHARRIPAFSNLTEKADRAAGADARQFLGTALRPFILRRTKSQVAADLPEKFEQTIFCELDKPQRALYDELKEHYRQSLLGQIDREGLGKSKLQVLEALLRLRQAACHPGLLNKSRIDDPSAKLDTLLPRLAELADEGHKTIVFSQFTSFLSIARKKLDEQGVVYEYLDGKTRDRQERVNRFQTDETCKLFLISLKAGGLGLNLTAAQYVFLLDPWWNPAIEAQAIDRAHRIGQTQQVFAYRLIAKDTVEEKVLKLQQSKRELADAIINADNALISKLGREDLEMLLS